MQILVKAAIYYKNYLFPFFQSLTEGVHNQTKTKQLCKNFVKFLSHGVPVFLIRKITFKAQMVQTEFMMHQGLLP
jgi:hypothetical protein